MPRYCTYPNGQAGTFELDVYKGTPGDATKFGVIRYKDRDSVDEVHFHPPSGTWVNESDRFHRRVLTQDAGTGDPDSWGPWLPAGPQEDVTGTDKEKHLSKPDKEVATVSPDDLKDPDGMFVFVDGAKVPTPAVGEQARNAWTGELLWNDSPTNSVPTLVP